jgi:GNAT superfamily N-acetyltransferase
MHPGSGTLTDDERSRFVLANWEALATALATEFDGAVEDRADLFRARSGLHSGFMNGVLRVAVPPESVAEMAVEMRAWFPEGLPWRWVVGPGSAPPDLADRLRALGFEARWPHMPTMTIELEGFDAGRWAPGEGRVVEVLDPAGLDAWLNVRRGNLGLDDRTMEAWRRAHSELGLGPESRLRQFVAWLDGRPVGASTLYLDQATGTAGIYHVDVLADARGRGIGKAVTAAPLATARDLGYRLGVLSASKLGTPVYLALGFQVNGAIVYFVGGGH